VSGEWFCEAYGPEGVEIGAVCFFGGVSNRCGSEIECSYRMTGERLRIFDLIQAAAATGDDLMIYLAEQFTDPDQLLGGQG
jgi:hypothetical protein